MDDVEGIKSEVMTASYKLRDLYRERRDHEKTLDGLGDARDKAEEELRAWACESAEQDLIRGDRKHYELAGLCQKAREQTQREAEIVKIDAEARTIIAELLRPR